LPQLPQCLVARKNVRRNVRTDRAEKAATTRGKDRFRKCITSARLLKLNDCVIFDQFTAHMLFLVTLPLKKYLCEPQLHFQKNLWLESQANTQDQHEEFGVGKQDQHAE
jgi:hypothetical protein